MTTETPTLIQNKLYTIFLNKKEMGSINIKDIPSYMSTYYPGPSYVVNEEESTIHITASVVEMLEIVEYRKAHIIHD
ncbi:hypothetical protein DFP95_12135 [Cohnella lupini]|uniref:Uncharacterized protein n=1 Tax=Cohnella lupini TaxID=1294267 RepID=A0A3D9HZG8_9BACL|nr:hypothetical protein DFP95_12135 [Cohnella lupini]